MPTITDLCGNLITLPEAADSMPVVVQSSVTGTIYEMAAEAEVVIITEEHQFLGCKLPVGTSVVFLKTK